MLSSLLFSILASASVSATVSVQIPLDSQYPPVAHVGQRYSWTISNDTFKCSSESISPNYEASPLPDWISFNPDTKTFSGTPSDADQGLPDITVTAHVGETSASSDCNILVTDDAAPTLSHPISEQFVSGNPSLSSVFVVSNKSALHTGNPTLRIPHKWSFSIGFLGDTFENAGDNVHYVVLQKNKAPPPYRMTFKQGPDTLGGTAPRVEDVGPLATYNFELLALASDSYTDGSLPFDIVIADNELSMDDSASYLPTANITRDATFNLTFGSSADMLGVLVNGDPIKPSQVSDISIDTSSCEWLKWDSGRRVLTGTTEGQNFDSSNGPRLPVVLTTNFNQSIHTILPLAIEPPCFTTETFPAYAIPDDGSFSFDIRPYLSNATGEQLGDLKLSSTADPSSCVNINSTSMVVEGSISGDCQASNITLALTAYSNATHSTSHATLPMTYTVKKSTGSSPHHPGSLSLAAHKRLILGMGIAFGVIGGLCALGTFLASARRCLRVQDSVLDGEQGLRHMSEGDKRWYGLVEEKAGYGWTSPSEKHRQGMDITRAPQNYGNIGLGLHPMAKSQTKDLSTISSSPAGSKLQSPGVMKKGDFMTRIRETVRNVSDHIGSQSRKSRAPVNRGVIGKPILLNAHEVPPPPLTTSKASPSDPFVGGEEVSTPPSVHFADLTRQLSTSSTASMDSIETHANEAVVHTATRHPSVPDSLRVGHSQPPLSRPRLVPFTSAARVPVPKLVTSSPDCSDASASGSILSARVISQSAKIWKASDEEAVPSSSGDELTMGIRYVRALGGDSHLGDSTFGDVAASTYTVSTHFTSSYSLDSPDREDVCDSELVIVGTNKHFETHIPVTSNHKPLRARLASGDPTPDWMYFDLIPKNGKVKLGGMAHTEDVGDWDIRILSNDGLQVGELDLRISQGSK